jgi:murein DD-endopeptidase MepM/ murein hydrolase activator NlpD
VGITFKQFMQSAPQLRQKVGKMHFYKFLYKWRFVFGGVFVIAVLFLLSLIVSSLDISKVQAKEAKPSSAPAAYISDSPNVVTSGAARAAQTTGQFMESAAYAAVRGIHAAATAIAQGGTLAASGVQTGVVAVATGIGNGVASVSQSAGQSIVVAGRAIGGGAGFVLRTPGNVAGFVKNLVVQDVIQPAHDHPEVPIIDPNSPELRAALAALPPAEAAAPTQHNTPASNPAGPAWPLSGRVTAAFGVPHWPFQPTHTGIDISTGQPAGTMPVTPFRPGKVIAAIHSSHGFGNHVILDHGSGVTSVYAHLDSISVQTGQEAGMGTVLGKEGTTGLSTGPHLHFEIRVNGQATNPRQFIGGNP